MNESQDIGISIGKSDFRALVAEYLRQMEFDEELSPEDCVTLTRLWNTIEFQHLNLSDDLYQKYYTAFFPGYVERVSECLDAMPTKGMALYSKEYDIYLGGTPHANSKYAIHG